MIKFRYGLPSISGTISLVYLLAQATIQRETMTHNKTPDIEMKKLSEKPEIKAVLSDAKSLVENSGKALSSAKEEGLALLHDGKKYLKENVQEDILVAKSYIKENPKKSAAVAILGAFLLKRLLFSKK